MHDELITYKILDLFSGAGGFSYGIEKNPHFKTLLALDFNERALVTFKKNMPDAETVVGDITDSNVKEKIINKSLSYGINHNHPSNGWFALSL